MCLLWLSNNQHLSYSGEFLTLTEVLMGGRALPFQTRSQFLSRAVIWQPEYGHIIQVSQLEAST